MKVAEVQKMEPGTPLWFVDFDPTRHGTIARVVPVTVAVSEHDLKTRSAYRYYTYNGRECRQAVKARHCYRTKAEAERELIDTVTARRDALTAILRELKRTANQTAAAAQG